MTAATIPNVPSALAPGGNADLPPGIPQAWAVAYQPANFGI